MFRRCYPVKSWFLYDHGRRSEIANSVTRCRLRSVATVGSYGNQSFPVCDQNISHSTPLQWRVRLVRKLVRPGFIATLARPRENKAALERELYGSSLSVCNQNSCDNFAYKNKKESSWEKIGRKCKISHSLAACNTEMLLCKRYCSECSIILHSPST